MGDVLTGGAFTARREARRVRRAEEETQQQLTEMQREERQRRRNLQRASLQRQPTLFDLLGGPGDV
ncbi:MAG: hypothetical protein EA406_02225 [Rhodospirillales bacterium]|nr:MAG: hypothetical protein EA406_02225 [Rhodospirillales bacterium]